jgi:hypothetical protein
MLNVLRSLFGAARSFFRTQRSLALENLALRHQVGVLKRTVGNRRLRIGPADRGLWATLSRVFDGWENALAIVQPATVIGWHRAGFRRFWTRKSRAGKPGRPLLDHAIRDLIRKMSRANPTANRRKVAVAKSLRRAAGWLGPARMSGSCHRGQRAAPTSYPSSVLCVLPPVSLSLVARRRRARAESRPGTGTGTGD